MYISVFMGPFSFGTREDRPLIDLCLEQAVQAAKAGFCMVTFGEQHFNNYEPYCNPFMMGARLAPFLDRTYFGTSIVPLVLHQPLRLAENINILDLLTRGRSIVGMSAGRVGFSPDFANFGLDPAERDAIFTSKLDLLLRAFEHRPGDPPLIMNTPYDKGALNGRLMPVAYRKTPLLAIGTNTDSTIATTARRGWPVFLGPCLPRDAGRKLRLHRDALVAAGHAEDHVERARTFSFVTRHVIVADTEDEAWSRAERMVGSNPLIKRSVDARTLRQMAEADLADRSASEVERKNTEHVQSWIIAGDPDSVRRQLRAYQTLGVDHVNTRFVVGNYKPEDIRRSFELFVGEVLPSLEPQFLPAPIATDIRDEHSEFP